MAKVSSSFICQQCGYHSPQFLGKCPECGTWNSFVEQVKEKSRQSSAISRQTGKTQIVNLADIEKRGFDRLKSGIDEFDRVLGGGIVAGSLILVAGDPGIGKSTLLLQLALNMELGARNYELGKKQDKSKNS